MLDDLAGEAAQRALELRALAEKGARSRKKKALVDFMRALAQAGASAKRSAVPAAERSVHAWFSQVPPLATHAILARLPLSSERLMKGSQCAPVSLPVKKTSKGCSSRADDIGYAGEPGCGCEEPARGEQWAAQLPLQLWQGERSGALVQGRCLLLLQCGSCAARLAGQRMRLLAPDLWLDGISTIDTLQSR